MFESKEEVSKAIMDLKIFEGMDSIGGAENNPQEEVEEYEETISQVLLTLNIICWFKILLFCLRIYIGSLLDWAPSYRIN